MHHASMGIVAKVRQRFARRAGDSNSSHPLEAAPNENLLDEPEQAQENEISQSHSRIDFVEQLQMIQIVRSHMTEYILPGVNLEPNWIAGHAISNEIFVSRGDEEICRSNIEAFYQDKQSGIKKLVYLVSLIRFSDDLWRVFQVKEKTIMAE